MKKKIDLYAYCIQLRFHFYRAHTAFKINECERHLIKKNQIRRKCILIQIRELQSGRLSP